MDVSLLLSVSCVRIVVVLTETLSQIRPALYWISSFSPLLGSAWKWNSIYGQTVKWIQRFTLENLMSEAMVFLHWVIDKWSWLDHYNIASLGKPASFLRTAQTSKVIQDGDVWTVDMNGIWLLHLPLINSIFPSPWRHMGIWEQWWFLDNYGVTDMKSHVQKLTYISATTHSTVCTVTMLEGKQYFTQGCHRFCSSCRDNPFLHHRQLLQSIHGFMLPELGQIRVSALKKRLFQ